MKIIGISKGRELPIQVSLMADSAVIRTNKPFFVPHFAQRFTGKAALVLHIDRLGKHIAPRFAHRYCMSMAPGIKVTAHDIDMEQQCEKYSALSQSFDGALLLGDFIAIEDHALINSSMITVECNGLKSPATTLNEMGIDYRLLISQLSTFFTLKMGDMIVTELGDATSALKPGDTLSASINGLQQLTIRVK